MYKMSNEFQQQYDWEIEAATARARAELVDLIIHEEKCRRGKIVNVPERELTQINEFDLIDDLTGLEEAAKALQKETHSTGAQKEIVGKLRYDLVPVEFEDELAKVYTEGAKKYSDRNWEKGLLFMKHHYAAARRHMAKWVKGIDLDDETNTHHLANAAWHLAAIITLSARGRTDLDDRNK
jgi:hypothetical protein